MIFKILLSVLQYVTLSLYSDMFSILHNEPLRPAGFTVRDAGYEPWA